MQLFVINSAALTMSNNNTEDHSRCCKAIGYLDVFWGVVCILLGAYYLVNVNGLADEGIDSDMATAMGYFFPVVGVVDLVTGPVLVVGVHVKSRTCVNIWIAKVG